MLRLIVYAISYGTFTDPLFRVIAAGEAGAF